MAPGSRVAPPSDRAIPPDLPHAVVRRDPGHAATRMRGARTLIETPDRSPVVRVAGCRTHVEELLRRELTVEDVPPDQPPLVLHVVRADHLTVQDAVGETRRHLLVPGDHSIGVRIELFGMRL